MVDLQHYVELEDMVHMTIKVEWQLKNKWSTKINSSSSSSWKLKWSKDENDVSKSKIEPFKDYKEGGNQSKGKSNSQHSRNRDIKCFKYLGTRHIASQWPFVMLKLRVNQIMILSHLWRMLMMVYNILLIVNWWLLGVLSTCKWKKM